MAAVTETILFCRDSLFCVFLYSSHLSLSPGLAGLYFRDIGYFALPSNFNQSSGAGLSFSESYDPTFLPAHDQETSKANSANGGLKSDDPRCYRINQFFRARLEKLMNTEYSHRVTITICPNLLEVPDPVTGEESSYESWHAWFRQYGAKLKTPPLQFPPFSVDRLIAIVPEGIALTDVDKTLAAGWSNRRETRAGTDVKAATEMFQV